MRIKGLSGFIKRSHLKNDFLQNSSIVVDAQNFFYYLYQDSGLQYVFGCESDKYAAYLKNYLSMFKKANVTCYFIFKGGHEDHEKILTKLKETKYESFDINKEFQSEYKDIVLPIFMKDVYKQVLDEMNFNYTICEYESKKECIALAQKLKCPVVSDDIEFCFSGLSYIMKSTLKFDKDNNCIKCGIFMLDDFLKNTNLNEEKLALFVALTDEKEFPEGYFSNALPRSRNIYERNLNLLSWFSKISIQNAFDRIFQYTNEKDKDKITNVINKTMKMTKKNEVPGIPSTYLLNGNQIEVTQKDEFWFQKGVASKKIAIQYINLVRLALFEATWAISDRSADDARFFSKDIIIYAFTLLTNLKKNELKFVFNNMEISVPITNSVQKSKKNNEFSGSPFENGWNNLTSTRQLFEHFLTETVQGFDMSQINRWPEDLRMLIVALIFFIEKKPVTTKNHVCSIILSYIALSVVSDDRDNNLISAIKVKDGDVMFANNVLAKYLTDVTKEEAERIFDVKLLHPLVEFQHCLENLNFLNVLCGNLYKPTVYSKTYNGTFVYKVLYTIENDYKGNCEHLLAEELKAAPSVHALIQRLMNTCHI